MIPKLRRLRQVIRSSRLSLVHSEFQATLGCTNPCLKKILFINKASKQGRNKLGPLGPGWLVYCRTYCRCLVDFDGGGLTCRIQSALSMRLTTCAFTPQLTSPLRIHNSWCLRSAEGQAGEEGRGCQRTVPFHLRCIWIKCGSPKEYLGIVIVSFLLI